MNWYDSLPATDARLPCGSGTHVVRWEAGQLALPSHQDAEAELVLAALGGDKPACVAIAEHWARHATDLTVLAAGPRCATDLVSVSAEDIEQQRAGLGQGFAAARFTATFRTGMPLSKAGLGMAPGPPGPAGPPGLLAPASPLAPGVAETLQRRQQRIELLELLSLGAALQFRLSGTVCAAWAAPDRADDRAGRLPELAAALTGRFAPAAHEWLGIDPDAVTVTPHEGPGWGTLELTGQGQHRHLRAALPVGWLAEVWACGLAVVDGHLVVAVEAPGYPQATVLALSTSAANPVTLEVHATANPAAALPAWAIAPRR